MPLGYFPMPRPGELLYSTMARLHQELGQPPPYRFVPHLYGKPGTPSRSILYAVGLNPLFQRLPQFASMMDDIVNRHTVFPLIAPFISGRQRAELGSWFIAGRSTMTVRSVLTRTMDGIYLQGLRLCDQCLENDQKSYPTPYWHRMHQWGLDICPVHHVLMRRWTPSAKTEFDWVTIDQAYETSVVPDLSRDRLEEQKAFAEFALWLLANGTSVGPAEATWGRYENVLRQRAIMSHDGIVSVKHLRELVVASVSNELAQAIGIGAAKMRGGDWLADMFLTRNPKVHSPLRHMVLIRALGLSVAEFFAVSPVVTPPFGDGPWACVNPAAPHQGELTIEHVTLTKHRESHRPLGTFQCPVCEFAYQRLGPDNTPAQLSDVWRILNRGPVWEAEFKRLYADPTVSQPDMAERLHFSNATFRSLVHDLGLPVSTRPQAPGFLERWDREIRMMWDDSSLTLKDIADEIGCSPRSITLYALAIGLPYPRKKAMSRRPAGRSQDKCRREFLELREQHPEASRTELKFLNISLYTWLHLHDKDWMEAHLPQPRKAASAPARINWAERDAVTVPYIAQAHDRLVALEHRKPIRQNTVLRVVRAAFGMTVSSAMLAQMPLTTHAIGAVVESHDQYIERRIRSAVRGLQRQGEPVRRDRLLARYPELRRYVNTDVGVRVLGDLDMTPSGEERFART